MKRALAMLALAAFMVIAARASAQETTPPPTVLGDAAGGAAEWEKIYAVFSHPRCANCHVDDARPRWSGPEFRIAQIHGFNVQRGTKGLGNPGLPCKTCHSSSNSNVPHGPPGALKWQLAPAEMVWFGKSSAEVCAQIKDPARTHILGLDKIADHVRNDPLVAWGWKPGPGREAAPGSAEETFLAIKRWYDAGAPCP